MFATIYIVGGLIFILLMLFFDKIYQKQLDEAHEKWSSYKTFILYELIYNAILILLWPFMVSVIIIGVLRKLKKRQQGED